MMILVINCGSSTLKFQLIDAKKEQWIAKGLCERIGLLESKLIYTKINGEKQSKQIEMKDHTRAIQIVLETLVDAEIGVVTNLEEITAVGHRVVHGGEHFSLATLIDDTVITAIEECIDLAPLHNPANLIGIRACKELMGNTPMVAVFDTAFHQTMPEKAYLYGLPYKYYETYKIRRYGFHGTSHGYVMKQVAKLLNNTEEKLNIITCHLGNGASVSAIKEGKCIDTSMGFTPLEGLIMGTRTGDVDPAIMEFIARKEKLSLEEVVSIYNHDSGVLGLTDGEFSDFRDIEDGMIAKKEKETRALETFCYRVAKYIGAYVAAMNGVDVICFTAGVGENSPIIRSMICEYLGYLGIEIVEEANNRRGEDIIITTEESKTKVAVIPTNEELAIANETQKIVSETKN